MGKSGYLTYEFDHPRKRELEEWLVIVHRLREVEDALRLVHASLGRTRKIRPAPVGGTTSTRSNYCFAAVTYMRCFSTGRYRRLSISSIPGLTATNVETHTQVKALRNTFFAHAVSDDHEGEHVYLRAIPGSPIDGFTSYSVVLVCDSKQGVRNFMSLAAKVRKYVLLQSEQVGDEIAVHFFGTGAKWRDLSKVAQRNELRA